MDNIIRIEEHTVAELLRYEELIPAVEIAFGNFSKGKEGGVIQPVRITLPVEKHNGICYVMPCVYSDLMATKIVTFYKNNVDIPSHQCIIVLSDGINGSMKAILAGETLTSMRTAAMSAVATKYLAPKNSQVLAIIGAGLQARAHYHALHHIIRFRETRIWNRTFSRARTLAEELNCTACETAEEAVKDADVIVTVTSSSTPVLKFEWVKNGAHVNCVGACRSSWQEVDPELMRNSVVYVDSLAAAMVESGDVILSKCDVYGEIGEMINGSKEAKTSQTTLFKSLGLAVMDTIASKMVYDKYCQMHPK